jgi:hypothetical protein
MATAVKEKETSKALSANDVEFLDYVDENKFYMIDLQVGSQASWKPPGKDAVYGQDRKVVPLSGGGFEHRHNPKVCLNQGPFPGSIVNGRISSHNDWIKKYRQRKDKDYAGQVDRQILVLDVRETENVPAQSLASGGMVPISMVERIARSIAQEELSTMIGSK